MSSSTAAAFSVEGAWYGLWSPLGWHVIVSAWLVFEALTLLSCSKWPATMHGALISGLREAAKIRQAFEAPRKR